jgi:flagellar FliJ protein
MAVQSTVVIKMLQDKAIKDVEAAQKDFAIAIKAVDEAKDKEKLLMEYRQGYSNDLTKSLNGNFNVESYKNTQNFLTKLDEAIIAQAQMINMVEVDLDVKRKVLQGFQKKKLSYDVLLQRADKRQMHAELKRDQKIMDEFAMRASRIRK